jgi:hypothetical protein
MDTSKIVTSINLEIGLLNSARPFCRKYVWKVKAKIPPKHRTNEKMKPCDVCLETNINPQRMKSKSGK